MTSSSRCPGSRSAAALLVGLALSAGLTACGSDGSDDTATDPASSSPTESESETPSETPSETSTETPTETPSESAPESPSTIPATGSAGVTEAVLLSGTEGGGSASTLAFALDTDQAIADFAAQLDPGFASTVTTAADEMAAGVEAQPAAATPYGAVAAIGCDAPRSVAIEAGEAGFEVTPKLPKNTVECFAPVTYVVLFAVPDA